MDFEYCQLFLLFLVCFLVPFCLFSYIFFIRSLCHFWTYNTEVYLCISVLLIFDFFLLFFLILSVISAIYSLFYSSLFVFTIFLFVICHFWTYYTEVCFSFDSQRLLVSVCVPFFPHRRRASQSYVVCVCLGLRSRGQWGLPRKDNTAFFYLFVYILLLSSLCNLYILLFLILLYISLFWFSYVSVLFNCFYCFFLFLLFFL